MSEDFYDVLGVSKNADEEEIQSAYREKAAQYRPDVSDDPDAEEKFKKAKKAKEVLTDEQKRRAYDRLGHERFEEAEKRGGFDGPGGAGAAGQGMGGMGGDPFGGGGQNPFGDIFEQFFGGNGGRGRSRPRQGADLRTELELDLEEAYHGVEKEVTIKRPDVCEDCNGEGHPPESDSRTCPECNGQGQIRQVQQTPLGRVQQTQTCRRCSGEGTLYDETCSTCRGEGTVRRETTLEVDIPAGIKDGQTLRMDREGAPGEDGGPRGDLLIDVTIADHPDFEREDDDLHYHEAVSFPQLVFGDTVEIPTVDGTVDLEIPDGTQSGEQFVIEGEGMPRLRGRDTGDLYVTVQLVTPESLNEDQREALEQFAEAGGEEIEVEQGFFERLTSSF